MHRMFGIVTAAAVLSLAVSLSAKAAKLVVTSPTLTDGGVVPNESVFNGYGYNGDNRSPALVWSGAPAATKSFAVTVYDPDAPKRGGWWHWLVFDIPAGVDRLPENAGSGEGLPPGTVQGLTDFETPGYGGPCPPPGKPHHYVFTVYALSVPKLAVSASDPPAKVAEAIKRAALAHAAITATFGKG